MRQQVVLGRGGQRPEIGKAGQKSFVIRDNSRHAVCCSMISETQME